MPVIYLWNVLITFVFDGPGCLFIKKCMVWDQWTKKLIKMMEASASN